MEPLVLKSHIIERLNNTVPEGLDTVLKHFKFKLIQKGERLIEFNEICQAVYFIERGMIQVCYLDSEDNIWTRDLATENQWCSNLESFEHETPSKEEYICLTDCVLWYLDKFSFQEMLKFAPEFGEIYRQILRELYFESIKQSQIIASKTAEQRILWLYKEKPHLTKLLTAKVLANYLHLHKDVFGRVRSKVLKIQV